MAPAEPVFRFGTKAETLAALPRTLSTCRLPASLWFTVGEWRKEPFLQLVRIREAFGDRSLAVRSSALIEDSGHDSHAGAFTSVLGVGKDDSTRTAAIEKVALSYAGNPRDQVLVQPMVERVAVAGVMTTRSLSDGGPYYEISYDDHSGLTDTITGGIGANKSVVIHRAAPDEAVASPRVLRWLRMARELERVCGDVPLDIEFAEQDDEVVVLLQVRRIAAQRQWDPRVAPQVNALLPDLERAVLELSGPREGLLGRRSIFGEMPDWNPAEIIGTSPRPLAASLYRHLVTDAVWREARAEMGYRHPVGVPLMVLLAGRPYIDVRASFNSFIPADLDERLATSLTEAWLERLASHPELHDKVEFEVAQTSLDFSFATNLAQRYPGLLSTAETARWRDSLARLTNAAMDLGPGGSLARALSHAQLLKARQLARSDAGMLKGLAALDQVATLLSEAITLGTRPFAVAARHAFIADALLRSAVARGALSAERLQAFRRSLQTVAGELSRDVRAVLRGELGRGAFMATYGHLRPGTYEVLSARYDRREDLFSGVDLPATAPPEPFSLTSPESEALSVLLVESGLNARPAALLEYAGRAVVAREWVKFIFTRNLSDAMEVAATWAAEQGLSREELSQIPLERLLDQRAAPLLANRRATMAELASANEAAARVTRGLRLNYLLRDERDMRVVPLHRSAPNFVTARRLEARTVYLDAQASTSPDLFGAIVCIENADPGYDWIFLRGIAGLVTRFGGANSHMAIRCAEFGLPAAIGCGEQTFERCVQAGRVELDCAERRVRPVHHHVT